MQGKIENISKSKSGKTWRVKIGGQFYGANFDSNLDSAVGKMIDFNYEDGEFGKWVKSWDYLRGGSQAPSPGPQTAPNSPAGAGSTLSEPELRFISNVVGQAILSKTLTDPSLIGLWAKAARQTLKELG